MLAVGDARRGPPIGTLTLTQWGVDKTRSTRMKFSIRGFFAFEFSLAFPHFWRKKPAGVAADYELE